MRRSVIEWQTRWKGKGGKEGRLTYHGFRKGVRYSCGCGPVSGKTERQEFNEVIIGDTRRLYMYSKARPQQRTDLRSMSQRHPPTPSSSGSTPSTHCSAHFHFHSAIQSTTLLPISFTCSSLLPVSPSSRLRRLASRPLFQAVSTAVAQLPPS